MKYCIHCGNRMEDSMKFCNQCGAKYPIFGEDAIEDTPEILDEDISLQSNNSDVIREQEPNNDHPEKRKNSVSRKGMRFWEIFWIVMGVLSILLAFTGDDPGLILCLGSGLFMFIIAAMFHVLSKSPKTSEYILGRSSGITKKRFVIGSILAAYAVMVPFVAIAMQYLPE